MITLPLHTQQCNHTGADTCANRGPGHELQPVQARVAAATSSKWVDGIVTAVSADGWIGVRLFGHAETLGASGPDAESTEWVWNHADLTGRLATGSPVAVHSLYNVLASGRSRISVVRI